MTLATRQQPAQIEPRRARRAAVYLRISLDHTGEGLAVERQREDAEQLAAARGWDVVGLYVDNSISASKINVYRPEYARLLADYRAGMFDALICYDLDRLTRKPRELEDWIDEAEQRDLAIVTMNGEADLTVDGGRLFARIKAAVAKGETERKGARQKRANRQRADMGRVPIGPRLFGYGQDGAIRADEAAVVRDLFERFAAGATIIALTDWMNAANVPARRGGTWSRTSVRGLLTNPRYTGRVIYQGKDTGKRGDWTPIVTDALFDAVQGRISDPRRKTNRVGTQRKNLGTGIYRCGVCGGPIVANTSSYWCPKRGHVSRTRSYVDAYVKDNVRRYLASPEIAARLANTGDDVELAELNAKSAELSKRLEAIAADYDAGFIDGRRFAVASDKVQTELEAVTRERSRLLAAATRSAVLGDPNPVDRWENATLGEQREVLDVVMTVTLHPSSAGRKGFDTDSVTIDWKV